MFGPLKSPCSWSQIWSHSPPFSGIHPTQPAPLTRRSRTIPDSAGHVPADLESVLGATPQEFESPILRCGDQALCRDLSGVCTSTLRVWSQFWFTIAPSWRRYSVCQQEPSSYSQSHPQEEIANCNFGPQGEIDLAGGGTRSHRKIRSLKIGRKG